MTQKIRMKNKFLGIDTSNYTSSCAVYDADCNQMYSLKKLLPVASGQLGLRQSDAVFHHTKNLPVLLSELCKNHSDGIKTVSVSLSPRDAEGSYMPCFLVGEGYANVLSSAFDAKLYGFSHQTGHVAAALWGADRTDLTENEFLAFHVSGGTTDMLYVKPSAEKVFEIDMLGTSLDLKAGQAVDRVGVMLGLGFPAGPELDRLACLSDRDFRIKPFMKDGCCSFSGVENKCRQMLRNGESKQDIAKYCIDYICTAIRLMTQSALLAVGDVPVIYAGGVMSNSLINRALTQEFSGVFAPPQFSSDNAAGTAFLGYIKETRKW